MKALVPTRSLAALLFVGFLDLVTTMYLHLNGLMVELNPIMRFFLIQNEWLFAAVKTATLVVAWGVMVWYARTNKEFVRQACAWGAGAYVAIWSTWFMAGHFLLR